MAAVSANAFPETTFHSDAPWDHAFIDVTGGQTDLSHQLVTWSSIGDGENEENGDSGLLDPLYKLIGHYLILVVSTPLCVFGLLANVINLVIFSRQDRRDCVSVCLLSLASSDFCCCVTRIIFNLLYLSNVVRDLTIIDPLALDVTFSYLSAMFYDISQGITAFVAFQRCLCVARPLTFKNIFTFKLSVGIMLTVCLVTFAAYLPHYLTCGLYMRFDSSTNTSIIALWQGPTREEAIHWMNYILHIGVETSYNIIVIVSACVMVVGLRRSSAFRSQEVRQQKTVTSLGHAVDANTLDEGEQHSTQTRKSKPDAEMARGKIKSHLDKNQNVVKTILVLAILASICNTERLIAVYGQRFVPGLIFNGKYRNFFFMVVRVTYVFGVINSSCNVLVYLTFNNSYRKTFLNIFCFRPKPDAK